MALQARARVTRQKIVDAAIDLFDQVGYGNTGLNDIADRAGVPRSAFYYYFPSKDCVAAAIFEQADARAEEALALVSTASPSPLHRLILLTFAMADITEHDKVVRVGNLLRQALSQVSPAAQETFDKRRQLLLLAVTRKAIAAGELRGDIDPEAVANTILIGLLGARLLSDADGEDVFTRLTQHWTVTLRGIAAPRSAAEFQELVGCLAQRFRSANMVESGRA